MNRCFPFTYLYEKENRTIYEDIYKENKSKSRRQIAIENLWGNPDLEQEERRLYRKTLSSQTRF